MYAGRDSGRQPRMDSTCSDTATRYDFAAATPATEVAGRVMKESNALRSLQVMQASRDILSHDRELHIFSRSDVVASLLLCKRILCSFLPLLTIGMPSPRNRKIKIRQDVRTMRRLIHLGLCIFAMNIPYLLHRRHLHMAAPRKMEFILQK